MVVRGKVHPWVDSSVRVCGFIIEMINMAHRVLDNLVLEETLRSNAMKAMWLLDMDSKIVDLNTAAERMAGPDQRDQLMASVVDPTPARNIENLQEAIRQALVGDPHEINTMINGHEIAVEVFPSYDDLEQIVGVVVAQHVAEAFTIDEEGLILTCNHDAALMLDVNPEEVIGEDFLDLIGNDSQEDVFEATVELMEDAVVGDRRVLEHVEVARINEEGELVMEKCHMELVLNNIGGVNQVMIMLEPEKHRRLVDGHLRKCDSRSNSGSARMGKWDRMAGWEGARWSRLRMEKVNLQHVEVGGALGENEEPTEPKWKMLYHIKGGEMGEAFDYMKFRKWMLMTQPDDRPPCLQNLNAWREGGLRAAFANMDSNGDGEVQDEEFEDWWHREVGEEEIVAVDLVVNDSDQMQQTDSDRLQMFDHIMTQGAKPAF